MLGFESVSGLALVVMVLVSLYLLDLIALVFWPVLWSAQQCLNFFSI